MVAQLAGEHIDAVVGNELFLLPLDDAQVVLAPVQYGLEPVEHVVLLGCAASLGEGIALVARETAWEVLAHVAIGDALGAVHQHLAAVVELRNALDGEQQRQGLFEPSGIMSLLEEAVGVMVLNKRHHRCGIGVKIVEHQTVVHAVEAAPLAVGGLDAGRIHHGVEREVHHRAEVGVVLSNLAVTLPGSGVGGVLKPCLAHNIEVGVLAVERAHPACHRFGVGIGVGVHAYAIDAHRLNPPDAVLNQVVHHMHIVLVEVGHGRYEPSLHCLLQVDIAGIGVKHRCQAVASLLEAGAARVAGALRLLEPLVQVEPVV